MISMKLVLLIAALLLGLVLIALFSGPKDQWSAKPLLTQNEREFFSRLLEALPDFHIFPQVAFRAILRPAANSGSKSYARQSGRIGAKHCDFLICNEDLDVVAIIELDDRTHVAEKDAARDAMTASAGYRTIRYQSRAKPHPDKIRQDVLMLQRSKVAPLKLEVVK